jgi:hypothetical protein
MLSVLACCRTRAICCCTVASFFCSGSINAFNCLIATCSMLSPPPEPADDAPFALCAGDAASEVLPVSAHNGCGGVRRIGRCIGCARARAHDRGAACNTALDLHGQLLCS